MLQTSRSKFDHITIILACVFLVFAAKAECATAPKSADMESAFWSRDWRAADAIYAGNKLSDHDLSLYLNALWVQGRYKDGLDLLDRDKPQFSAELTPYVQMFRILANERMGAKGEAYALGKSAWAGAPAPIKFYLAYAMGRLAKDGGNADDSLDWYRKMNDAASDDKAKRKQALEQIVSTGKATPTEAAALLLDSPSNAKARAVCEAAAKGDSSPVVSYALGYSYYAAKNYPRAKEFLGRVKANATYGEAARYYLAYVAYREKRDGDAFAAWSAIAATGTDYPQRSVQRLVSLASRYRKADIVNMLLKVGTSRDIEEVAVEALLYVARNGDGSQKKAASSLLCGKYQNTAGAAQLRWERGWDAWKTKNFALAETEWRNGAGADNVDGELASRLLYWRARSLIEQNKTKEADAVSADMALRYPFEYYSFLASPGVKRAVQPVSPDIAGEPGTLEKWGFVTYARVEATVGKPDKIRLYRSARLALWSGDFSVAARLAAQLQKIVGYRNAAAWEIMECLYPRAYESDVTAASGKSGVEPAMLWGVMRQESLFEADVVSSAGAYGLMQLMPATAAGEAKRLKMPSDAYLKPTSNILLGAIHLSGLFARFKDAPLAFASYNAGGTPVKRWSEGGIKDMTAWIEDIPYKETRGYVKAVLRNMYVYRFLYKK